MPALSNRDALTGQIESVRDLIDSVEWSLLDQLYDLQHTLDEINERLTLEALKVVDQKPNEVTAAA
jgi:hypothetical protein